MAKDQKTKRKKTKTRVILVSLGCLTLAAGYHTGRATSTNWNSEQTAFLYACRASHRLKNASDRAVLELPLPDAEYRYDGKDVTEVPIASVVGQERYPVLGADEYDAWLNAVLAFGAGAGAKTAWDVITDSSEMKGFQRVLAEERVLLSVVTVGSFGGGYLLGHRSNPSFDGPLFRAALRDKNEWKRIQSYKDQLAQAKANLDETRKNLKALQTAAGTPDKKTLESKSASMSSTPLSSRWTPTSRTDHPPALGENSAPPDFRENPQRRASSFFF